MQLSSHWSALKARIASRPRSALSIASVLALILIAALAVWFIFFRAPSGFPLNHLVMVSSDAPLSQIAADLESERVISSAFLFSAWMRITGQDRNVHAGSYLFKEPAGLLEVASRIHRGERGIESVRVTLPEGMTVREMGGVFAHALPDFSAAEFVELSTPYEGYLFPDTYFIEPGTTPLQMRERMRAVFDERIAQIDIAASGRSLEEVVIMASIIEEEANKDEDRYIVSGILWNRIAQDMPLQVDAVFGYIRGVSGYAPTASDLKIDSPYNTYRNRGLPPGPIANPGLASLQAAAAPAETSYLYYLTGQDGNMYYAHTFEAHKRNRELYLD
ncbi:MAG TPA: endolytic transglycosylase MltG [Candidatus Paceibacterota bacterium]|nr:endolytic transglycosylase MltG [Candidatus Paceibacterota bacterium]